ncbi:hypothetical protein [Novosphingobium sp.]|jgi:hypothetical protein|uniref:hypothetical protein n=1 Tax=Novosphingobium sp. TaxID=1874826 RepID=UPI002FE2B3BE
MQRHLLKQIIATLILCAPTTAWASEVIHIDKIEKVMVGQSSSGNDQVWVRIAGFPAGVATECVYDNYTLLYVADDQIINRDKAFSMLLSAKASGSNVDIAYDVVGTAADFWGFGISKCVIRRISMG